MYELKHEWTTCKRCAGRIRKARARKYCNPCFKVIYGYLPNTIISGLAKKGGLSSGGGGKVDTRGEHQERLMGVD
jgi:hypothetical protein